MRQRVFCRLGKLLISLSTIRWNATRVSDNSIVNFAVVLFQDGHIRFDYGSGNASLSPTIGVSFGNGQISRLASYDGEPGAAPPIFDRRGREAIGKAMAGLNRYEVTTHLLDGLGGRDPWPPHDASSIARAGHRASLPAVRGRAGRRNHRGTDSRPEFRYGVPYIPV